MTTTQRFPKNFNLLKDPFRGSAAREQLLVTQNQLRSTVFRRLFQDVYVYRDVPVTHELRCRGAALIMPEEAVLTGRSAATIGGVPLAKPYDDVEFIVPKERRFGSIRGIHARRTRVLKNETRPWRGIRIARPKRVALDLLLRHSPREEGWVRRLRTAVPELDVYLRAKKVSEAELAREAKDRKNRGIIFVRRALSLSDKRAESLPESEVRVILNHAKIYPQVQHKVWRRNKFLGRLDLAIAKIKLAIEYDGKWHDDPDQRVRDKRRRSRLIAEGWHFVILKAEDLYAPWESVVTKIRAAIVEASSVQLSR